MFLNWFPRPLVEFLWKRLDFSSLGFADFEMGIFQCIDPNLIGHFFLSNIIFISGACGRPYLDLRMAPNDLIIDLMVLIDGTTIRLLLEKNLIVID